MTLDHALEYAGLGLRIFPVGPDKRPKIKAWPTEATDDVETIRGWWQQYPDAGIGLATGDRLGESRYLFVLDVDEHEGTDSGTEALAALEAANSPLPETPTVETPSGGRHYYLTSPRPITNARGALPAGIDVRGKGGYVVLPPTETPAGSYSWDGELGDLPIAAAPEWLLDILDAKLEPTTRDDTKRAPSGTPDIWDDLDDRPGTEWARTTTWAELLEPDGWTHLGQGSDGEDLWSRPGQTEPGKIGATTNYGGADRLVVHSTNAPIPTGSYSKLGYLAAAHHGGDFGAAAKSLRPEPTTSTKTEATFPDPEPGQEWPEPTPIARDHEPPEFPLDVFPAWIRHQIEQASEEMQLGTDLPAMLALGALSTVAGGRVTVNVDHSYTEPTNLYLVVALAPGAGKSPVFKMMIERPLGRFERELDEAGAHARELRAHLRKAVEKELEKAIASGNEEEIRNAHNRLTNEFPEEPTPKLFVDDVTVEKLGEIMRQQRSKLALVSTEGGLFEQMAGRYGDKKSANLDPYLMAWSGDTMRVDRVERGELRVYDPALTIALTVQPIVIEALGDRPEYRGRGLTARFMYSFPVDRVGTRDFRRSSSYRPGTEHEYTDRLLDIARNLREQYETDPLPLRLSEDAQRLIREMKDRHEPQLAPGGDLYDMREWITKAQSSAVRVAGLLHVAERTGEIEIGVDTVEKALVVLDYWIAHSRRVHDLFSADDRLRAAREMLEHIERKVEPGGTFTLRDVTQWSRTGPFSRAESAVPPLLELIEYGWVRPDVEGPITFGRGRPSPGFRLSPKGARQAHSRLTRLTTLTESGRGNDSTTESDDSEPMSLVSHRHSWKDIYPQERVDMRAGAEDRLTRLTRLTSPGGGLTREIPI